MITTKNSTITTTQISRTSITPTTMKKLTISLYHPHPPSISAGHSNHIQPSLQRVSLSHRLFSVSYRKPVIIEGAGLSSAWHGRCSLGDRWLFFKSWRVLLLWRCSPVRQQIRKLIWLYNSFISLKNTHWGRTSSLGDFRSNPACRMTCTVEQEMEWERNQRQRGELLLGPGWSRSRNYEMWDSGIWQTVEKSKLRRRLKQREEKTITDVTVIDTTTRNAQNVHTSLPARGSCPIRRLSDRLRSASPKNSNTQRKSVKCRNSRLSYGVQESSAREGGGGGGGRGEEGGGRGGEGDKLLERRVNHDQNGRILPNIN